MKQKTHTTQGDYHKLQDEELAYRYSRKLDQAAFSCLFDRYGHIVYGVCLKYLGSVQAATRATEDIFLRMTEELKGTEIENFKAWLYHFTEKYCLDRGGATGNTVQEEDFDNNWYMRTAQDGLQDKIAAAVRDLDIEQKNLVQLFYLEGKTYDEIAGTTGKPVEKIKTVIQSGRRAIRKRMEAFVKK